MSSTVAATWYDALEVAWSPAWPAGPASPVRATRTPYRMSNSGASLGRDWRRRGREEQGGDTCR